MQSLYDDGSDLLLTAQAIGCRPRKVGGEEEDTTISPEYLDAISTCMRANLDVVLQTLEALLAVGHDQADLSQGDYNGSIEWRMSRLSLTPTQSDRTYRPGSSISLVDMAMAFNPNIRRPKGSISSTGVGGDSTLYGSDTASMGGMMSVRSETPPGTISDHDGEFDDQSEFIPTLILRR